jgi:hypothetical protein
MRKLLAVGTAVTIVFAVLLLGPLGVSADVPNTIGSYNSYGYATGVHALVGTTAFPNFANGAIDNHYPLAQVKQDASPSSSATATYNDYGPLGATLHGCANEGGKDCPPVPEVPYARSKYPGGKTDDHIDSCSTPPAGEKQNTPCPPKDASGKQPTPSRADTHAEELKADASGYYAGATGAPFNGASAESHTVVLPDGSIQVRTHAFVDNATFGTPPQAIVINKVQVDITVTIVGGEVTQAVATVKVGSMTVNGQPYEANDQGATFTEQKTIPCPALPAPPGGAPPPPAPPALPGVPAAPAPPVPVPPTGGSCVPSLESDTYHVYTVAPSKKVTGNHAVIKASGVHVDMTHQSLVPGMPQQSAGWVIGEGYVDVIADMGFGGGSDLGGVMSDSGGDMGFGDSGAGGFGMGDQTADAGGAKALVRHTAALLRANRQPLALLFLLWECLLMGAAAAWVWTRKYRPDEDEVPA